MLKPRGLGRRVAQGPHSLLRQFLAKNKHIKQNQSLSGLHVIVICFRLSRRIQAPFRAVSGRIRQFQAESGNFRQNQALFRHFQAESGRIRQNQSESGRIRQNQAKSGKIGQPIGSGKSLVRDPTLFQEPQTAPPFWAEFFGCIPSKLKRKQTTIKPQAMASFFPRHGNCADKS